MKYYSSYLVKGKSSLCNILNATFIPQESKSQKGSWHLGGRLTDVTWINNRRFIEDSWMKDVW